MAEEKDPSAFTTPQEKFWAGEFGVSYVDRNSEPCLHSPRIAFWAKVLRRMPDLVGKNKGTCLELGANIGLNLKAIAALAPGLTRSGVEINKKAAEILEREEQIEVFRDSLLDFRSARKWDLVFTCGVLIHINPESLPKAYDTIHRLSSKYVMVCEYYNPYPVEIEYHGHSGKLFKRDFAGELLDRYVDLKLVDYGFVWRRDSFPLDDVTWFLMEKCKQ